MVTQWQKCISARASHSAFTDLCEFNQHLYCCFREATDHISGDGRICILKLNWQGQIIDKNHLRIAGADLRDPKLSVDGNNKLILLAYARYRGESGAYSQPLTWFSGDGFSWSSAKEIGHKYWWLWRLRWHQGQAFGVAYNRQAQRTALYSGHPLRTFECIVDDLFSLSRQAKGYPNESDMLFTQDNTVYVLLRRDADSCTAQLGMAKPPYRRWQWQDLGVYLGGPTMLGLDQERALVSGRVWTEQGPRTALLRLNLRSARIKLITLLPSAGDNSYPGMVIKHNALYVSYYSSHQQQKSCIYLYHHGDVERLLNEVEEG
ncbi:hypothetical protein [Lacimicrobium sp. SS2-24]|uniref:hypothetical protein n=1 Tax=Lacimicrobium sp. SS2-24 TaxID=2005569 RepID=UPI000B4A826B|nr:hypothetical protein [Lacimicrobium sp. SS2-24]